MPEGLILPFPEVNIRGDRAVVSGAAPRVPPEQLRAGDVCEYRTGASEDGPQSSANDRALASPFGAVPPHEFVACAADKEYPRWLPVVARRGGMNRASCGAVCSARGFELWGTQIGGDCYCGHGHDAFYGPGRCNAPCRHPSVPGEICGGRLDLSVYRRKS